jgi:hypothetical protein
MARREATLADLIAELEPGEEAVDYAATLASEIDDALDGAPNIVRLELASMLLAVAVLQIARQAYPKIDECNDTLDVLFAYVRTKTLQKAQVAVLGTVRPGEEETHH